MPKAAIAVTSGLKEQALHRVKVRSGRPKKIFQVDQAKAVQRNLVSV